MEELIRKYYNEELKIGGLSDFEKLSFDEKYRISQTLGFAVYNLSLAITDFSKTLSELHPKYYAIHTKKAQETSISTTKGKIPKKSQD